MKNLTQEQLAAEGGWAFPRGAGDHPGMTLRDWFAGLVIGGAVQAGRFELVGAGRIDDESLARHAYNIADAMLAERERPGRR